MFRFQSRGFEAKIEGGADMKTIKFFKTVLIFMSVCTTFDFCLKTSGLKLVLYHF